MKADNIEKALEYALNCHSIDAKLNTPDFVLAGQLLPKVMQRLKELEDKDTLKIPVSADALREVLVALNGPSHLVRELQATRSIAILSGGQNSISVLTEEFNAFAAEYNKNE